MKTLETERLLLRQWRAGDETDVYDYASGNRVGPMAGWKPHESIEETRALLSRFREEDETWAIEFKETGKVIGSLGLHARKRPNFPLPYDRELGYRCSRKNIGGLRTHARSRRRGARPSLSERGMRAPVIVSYFPFNLRSKRVIEKLGFRPLFRLPENWLRYDGALLDEIVCILTRRDFFGTVSGKLSP